MIACYGCRYLIQSLGSSACLRFDHDGPLQGTLLDHPPVAIYDDCYLPEVDSPMSRTYGETRNCAGCRFWSEMVARCCDGPVEAICLVDEGPFSGKYVTARQRCEKWKSGHFGAVDDPPNYGEETRALYAQEDAA